MSRANTRSDDSPGLGLAAAVSMLPRAQGGPGLGFLAAPWPRAGGLAAAGLLLAAPALPGSAGAPSGGAGRGQERHLERFGELAHEMEAHLPLDLVGHFRQVLLVQLRQ